MERLTEKGLFMGNIVFNCGEHENDCDGNCQDKSCGLLCAVVKKLKEYEDLEEQGKLLKLPCAVGDTLYVLTQDSPDGIEEAKCQNMVLLSKTKFIAYASCRYDDWGGAKWRFKITDFGKTVFLTRKEAEAALKEMSKE